MLSPPPDKDVHEFDKFEVGQYLLNETVIPLSTNNPMCLLSNIKKVEGNSKFVMT